MRFLSMFSGIEAASVAWRPLGWKAAAVCEIEKFPSAVLAHHYPDTPNLGDVTQADFDAIGPIDLAVFGSPCQSFSVAGKRLGLDDARGNLALVAGGIVYRKRPRWFVFENVPGLLSSDAGWDFGTLLAAFAGHPSGSVFSPPADGWGSAGVVVQADSRSYGLAWRVLDAQYFGVAQRRRRVFVVGYAGDWRRAAAVLFERHSLSGNPAPRREAGKIAAASLTGSLGRRGGQPDGGDTAGHLIPSTGETAHCLNAGGMGRQDYETETLIAHTLKGEGFGASEDGTGRGTSIVPVYAPDAAATLVGRSSRGGGQTNSPGHNADQSIVAFALRGREGGAMPEVCDDGSIGTLRAADGGSSRDYVAIDLQNGAVGGDVAGTLDTTRPGRGGGQAVMSSAVRRLTPRECERLQGFPDDYTLIPYRKGMAADGPRYKALGNSMAVPVMAHIGRRIQAVEDLIKSLEEKDAA